LADVLSAVGLSVEPPHLAYRQRHVATLAALGDEASLERGERVHDAVGVLVRFRRLPRLVAVLENADALVLEDDLVLVGIGARRVRHAGPMVLGSAAGQDRQREPVAFADQCVQPEQARGVA
jgi:hypothetical protein